ncbi:MAG: MASE3 domain-containing protein, partial [Burkholderiales bacterium]
MTLSMTHDRQSTIPEQPRGIVWFLIGATLLFLAVWLAPKLHTSTTLAGYAPLHTSMELFAIVISMLIFGVAWNAYSSERPGNVLILACGFLAVALVDFVHVLTFPGMPVFVTPAGIEKTINFWLAARLLAAGVLLAIALRRWEPISSLRVRYLLLTA